MPCLFFYIYLFIILMEFGFNLSIKIFPFSEPRIEILGSPDLYVQRASRINLTCIIYDVPEPPSFVLWHHEGRVCYYAVHYFLIICNTVTINCLSCHDHIILLSTIYFAWYSMIPIYHYLYVCTKKDKVFIMLSISSRVSTIHVTLVQSGICELL